MVTLFWLEADFSLAFTLMPPKVAFLPFGASTEPPKKKGFTYTEPLVSTTKFLKALALLRARKITPSTTVEPTGVPTFDTPRLVLPEVKKKSALMPTK